MKLFLTIVNRYRLCAIFMLFLQNSLPILIKWLVISVMVFCTFQRTKSLTPMGRIDPMYINLLIKDKKRIYFHVPNEGEMIGKSNEKDTEGVIFTDS